MDYGRAFGPSVADLREGKLGEFFYWYYGTVPRLILEAGRGYTRRVYFGFSIPTLARTIFAPWRRDLESGSGVPLGMKFRVLIDNLVSRVFGAVIRVITLMTGLMTTGLLIGALVVGWVLWLGLPFLMLIMLGAGVKVLIAGSVL